nr:MAG: protease polymerase P70 [Chemarfal virus 65]
MKLLSKYKKFFLNYSDFDYETIDRLITSFVADGCIKMDASPGLPYSTTHATNRKFLDTSIHFIIHLVWSRIQLRLKHRDVTSPIEMINLGLCDPVKLFVKEEPHKLRKIKEGRVRLIMSVSIIDKLIEMILIKSLKDLEIANWTSIPSKPGMGFTAEMVKTIYDRVHEMKRPISTDVEGWDWSVSQWLLDADADMIIRLCNNPFEDWVNLIKLTANIEGSSVYCLSDSRMFILTVRGNQNSGKLKTSMSNSRMRALAAIIAGCEDCICMGDDNVEEYVVGAIEKYQAMGIKVKIYEEINDQFEFCSKIFTNDSCYPVSYGKTLMKLLHQKPRSWEEYVGYMVGFEDEMRGHPQFTTIMDLINRTGFVQQGGEQMRCDEDE